MPTMLPTRATAPSVLDPIVHSFQAFARLCRNALGLANMVIAEEAAEPPRTLDDLVSDKPLRTPEGKRLSAREIEGLAFDL